MNTTPDRPPILRFLILFAGLLAVALALAAVASSVEPVNGTEAAPLALPDAGAVTRSR